MRAVSKTIAGGLALVLCALGVLGVVRARASRRPLPVPSAQPAPAEPSAAPAPTPAPTASVRHRPLPPDEPPPTTLEEQRSALFRAMETQLDLSPDQLTAVEAIVLGAHFIGQGNPKISHHAMSPAECRTIRAAAGHPVEEVSLHPPCDRENMVPLYDPGAGQTAADAPVCIDQFEVPDIACE